jgi:putative membrane protein
MKPFILLALAALPLAASPAAAKPAPAFLKSAAQGDNSEVTMGRLAEQRGGSAGVRSYGRTLARDHGAHLGKVQAAARPMHVVLPAGMKPDARQAYSHLQQLRGAAFDRTFVEHMIADHRKDIADYELQARTGDRATAALARQTLPTLREHLRLAQSLAR